MRMGRAGGLLVDGTAEEHLRPRTFLLIDYTYFIITVVISY